MRNEAGVGTFLSHQSKSAEQPRRRARDAAAWISPARERAVNSSSGSWKWWMCGALLVATMLNYMDRQTLSLTATQLKSEISLDDGRYGTLEEWFSYAFAAG